MGRWGTKKMWKLFLLISIIAETYLTFIKYNRTKEWMEEGDINKNVSKCLTSCILHAQTDNKFFEYL